MKTDVTNEPDTKHARASELVTEKEACQIYRVSREGLLKLRLDPLCPLPHLRVGRRVLYAITDLERWARRRAEREVKAHRPAATR